MSFLRQPPRNARAGADLADAASARGVDPRRSGGRVLQAILRRLHGVANPPVAELTAALAARRGAVDPEAVAQAIRNGRDATEAVALGFAAASEPIASTGAAARSGLAPRPRRLDDDLDDAAPTEEPAGRGPGSAAFAYAMGGQEQQAPAPQQAQVAARPEPQARAAELEKKYGVTPGAYSEFNDNSNRAEMLFNAAVREAVDFLNGLFSGNGFPDMRVTVPELATNFLSLKAGKELLEEDSWDTVDLYDDLGLDRLKTDMLDIQPWLHHSVIDKNPPPNPSLPADERPPSLKDVDMLTAVYASAGVYAHAKSMASLDLAPYGVTMWQLPQETQVYWTKLYLNTDREAARAIVSSQASGLAAQGSNKARTDASSGASSFELLRDTMNLDLPDHGAFPTYMPGTQEGTVVLDIETASLHDKQVSVVVEYSVDGVNYKRCTGDPVSGNSGGAEGQNYEFSWRSTDDLPRKVGVVKLRVWSWDGSRASVPQKFSLFLANGRLDLGLKLLSQPSARDPVLRIGFAAGLEPTHIVVGSDEHEVKPFLTGPGKLAVPLAALNLKPGRDDTVEIVLKNEPTGVDSEPLELSVGAADRQPEP